MKVVRIPSEVRQELKGEPEFSMGVQKALVKLSSGQLRNGWIFNGKFFLSDADKVEAERDSKALLVARIALLNATLDESLQRPVERQDFLTLVSVVRRSPESLKGVRQISRGQLGESKLHTFSAAHERTSVLAKSGGAKDAPVTQTHPDEIFKRFSAYKDDFRVTAGRGLTPGTFATTAADAIHVRTGAEAVARYALPNKTPANQVFTITPPEKTNLQRGIAQPAYGQPGGGVEVIFVDGSPDGTVYGPEEIPAT